EVSTKYCTPPLSLTPEHEAPPESPSRSDGWRGCTALRSPRTHQRRSQQRAVRPQPGPAEPQAELPVASSSAMKRPVREQRPRVRHPSVEETIPPRRRRGECHE